LEERERGPDDNDIERQGEAVAGAGEGVGAEEEAEVEVLRVAREPGAPRKQDRAVHNVTHCPYRSWCKHCVRGRATGAQHRSIVGEAKESQVARVMMGYGFLKKGDTREGDEHGASSKAEWGMTILVMLGTICTSVWVYALDGK
jgi:hypothetical protein